VTVTQGGLCTADQYQFFPREIVVNSDGFSSPSISVTAPEHCAWQAVSLDPEMIGIFQFPNIITGTGSFFFSVTKMEPPLPGRTGVIDIAGNDLVVEQVPQICFIQTFATADTLSLTRSLRDEILDRTTLGKEYKRIYYEFSPEAVRLSIFHPTLLWRAASMLDQYTPLIQSMLDGTGVTLRPDEIRTMDQLLADFQNRASPEFSRILWQLRKDLQDPQVQREFHVRIAEK
jgi:hypothetical protein